MTIEEKIQSIADDHFPQCGYIFDNLYRIDQRMETAAFPAIVCTLPARGDMLIRNGRVYDTEDVLIGFFNIVPQDANGEDNAAVYNDMKSLGIAFVDKMNESGLFDKVEAWNYEVWCFRMANIVTGVFFSIRIQDIGRCDVVWPQPEPDPEPEPEEPNDEENP